MYCIRKMDLIDIPQLFQIEKKAYTHPWTLGIIQGCMRFDYANFILEIEQQIRGYSFLSIQAGEAHLLNLTIHPEQQGQGFGTILLDFQLQQAKKRAADIIFLEVRRSNHIAQNLYIKKGFNEVGCRHSYYPSHNGKEDAIIFALSL